LKIENIKELRAVIKLCRELGVDSIEVDSIKLQLGSKPIKATSTRQSPVYRPTTDGTMDVPEIVDMPDELTDEQMMFYSSAPSVGN
jgi:hypothetical protein